MCALCAAALTFNNILHVDQNSLNAILADTHFLQLFFLLQA